MSYAIIYWDKADVYALTNKDLGTLEDNPIILFKTLKEADSYANNLGDDCRVISLEGVQDWELNVPLESRLKGVFYYFGE